MDARLHGRKCFVVAASAAPDDTGPRKSHERIGLAWEPGDVHGHRYKHNGHRRQLERQRRAGRKCHLGNNHFCGRVQRACGHAVPRNGASHSYKSRRFDKIGLARSGDYE